MVVSLFDLKADSPVNVLGSTQDLDYFPQHQNVRRELLKETLYHDLDNVAFFAWLDLSFNLLRVLVPLDEI
jgi:hypothetical protein